MDQIQTGAAPTRRRLLAVAGLGLAGLAATGASAAKAVATSGDTRTPSGLPFSLRRGGLADWSSLVGQSFAVGGSATSLKLVAVKALPNEGPRPAAPARSQAFTAHFETRANLAEGIYRLAHGLFSSVDLHLAPGRRKRMIAVFN